MKAASAVDEDRMCGTCGEYAEDGGYLCDKCRDSEDDGAHCGTCGEYAEDGYLCDRRRAFDENMAQCGYHCKGKIHHATEASAAEHVASLGGEAYAYECDGCNEWTDAAGNSFDNTGPHWHVASSPIPRKWREWVGES